ncbi:MAG TPA: hypothetical protein H9698_08205, partial [Candidatus Ruthenibacterium merdavium]|nr:hypothetical protein [Candidatus Ruthenibacterium merdavium]
DGGKLKRSATNEPSILSFFSLVFAWMTKNLLWTDFQSRFFYKLNLRAFMHGDLVYRKSFAFSQTVSLSQMEKRASPLFQAFFPLQPRFFLNQAAVFRQS